MKQSNVIKGLEKGTLIRITTEANDVSWGFFERFQTIKSVQYIVIDVKKLPRTVTFDENNQYDIDRFEEFIDYFSVKNINTYPEEVVPSFVQSWIKSGAPDKIKKDDDNSFN